ncbi:hypothetical protein JQX13_34005 [Archangium violaceum]|uniref:DUF3322 domain-containing protein n=1 Tax=Archangium violaceum TaxID=83451 RepID=UPI00193C3BAD|nr:DUF3322 domain-containing protein [Archangium violaceum]QRK05187.1 hypothetical protein JQX13_34005 [Archangium violaceum]
MSASNWSTPEELVEQLERMWDRGEILRASLTGEALFPKQLRVRRPSTKELGERFEDARRWIRQLEEDSRARGYLLEFEEVVHRQLGRNRVPGRVVVPTEADALRIIGKTQDAERFHTLREVIVDAFPSLETWVHARPLKVVELAAHWEGLLAVLRWFSRNPCSGLFRRQLEIEGVDTKFIEHHRQVLTELLELTLPPEQILSERGTSFDRRFGLREKPFIVRFRLLDETQFIQGFSDLAVPLSDLARLELPVDDVIVTENEVNGLALPPRPRTMVVFGQGYALERLGEVPWLASRRVLYWGDIDTHGFTMLDRFRAHFPRARSLLMDRETLLAHRSMWVVEETQSTEALTRLNDDERLLLRELLRGALGERVRLEQERIGFQFVRGALERAR